MNKKRSKTVRAMLLAVLAVLLLTVIPSSGGADDRKPICFKFPLSKEQCFFPPFPR